MIDLVAPTIHPTVQESIEILAVIAFALSGLAAALRVGMDFVGVCFVAGVSAFGGGTIRDLLLDRRPFFWVEQDHLLWLVILLCFLSSMFIRQSDAELTEKWIQVPDAFGLGLFAALGAQIALIAGSSTIVAILMGVISSTLGGVLRDILCNVVPKVFSDHKPYVTLAVLGSLIVIGLNHFGIVQWVALVVAIGVTTATRLLVLACNISIPIWRP
ncbi:MAG TPA: hypothetical protein DCQ47_01980 [Gammaproteobacteria bacterium]|nr:hypothetical protein [Gammaproteobacteria bacterium]|tara:strand:+ start:86 stop:730 length:645 start_codon:yes stop_codon:yes gene_type:complete